MINVSDSRMPACAGHLDHTARVLGRRPGLRGPCQRMSWRRRLAGNVWLVRPMPRPESGSRSTRSWPRTGSDVKSVVWSGMVRRIRGDRGPRSATTARLRHSSLAGPVGRRRCAGGGCRVVGSRRRGSARQGSPRRPDETPTSGTSYAAPVVSGVVAQLMLMITQLTALQVMQRIEDTARRPPAGWGSRRRPWIVDPLAAVIRRPGRHRTPAPPTAGPVESGFRSPPHQRRRIRG